MNTNFNLFMSQLKETNATLDFYCDFKKISKNVEEIAISLNMLNYLIGKEDLKAAVEALWRRDWRVFDTLHILIAVRKKDKKKFFDKTGQFHTIQSLFQSVDGVMEFLEETGLSEIFRNKKITNLEDYVFGVETGLDTNARKNRSGKLTELLVARIFTNAGLEYREQVSSLEFPPVSSALGVDQKVFDFAVTKNGVTYLIEVNFYSDGGSKLNEVARSYTELAPKINNLQKYEFVWITDGIGWNKARNKLQEAFTTIPKVYNLTTISDFIAIFDE